MFRLVSLLNHCQRIHSFLKLYVATVTLVKLTVQLVADWIHAPLFEIGPMFALLHYSIEYLSFCYLLNLSRKVPAILESFPLAALNVVNPVKLIHLF